MTYSWSMVGLRAELQEMISQVDTRDGVYSAEEFINADDTLPTCRE